MRERVPHDQSEALPLKVRLLMDNLIELGSSAPEPLLRRVLATYGMQRLTIKSRKALEHAYKLV